jgi:transcription initiation factor TFIID subunit 6
MDNEQEGIVKRRLHADDINMALQWRGSEKIYATGTVGASSSDDKKVNLEDYLKSEMDLRPPQEVGFTVHWLAVDGIQPDIPQNPALQQQRNVHRVEQEDNHNPNEADGFRGVQVTQLHERLFSEELQLYLKRITSAVERGGATPTTRQQLDAALASLARDTGLQELAPLFVKYVNENLYHNVGIGNSEHCRNLVRMAHSLLINPHLHLELLVRNKTTESLHQDHPSYSNQFPFLCLPVAKSSLAAFDLCRRGGIIYQTMGKPLDSSYRSSLKCCSCL